MEAVMSKARLSEKDMELIKLLCLPNKIISHNMGVSPEGIGMHIGRLIGKFGVENRTGVIVKALQLGLVGLGELQYRQEQQSLPFGKN